MPNIKLISYTGGRLNSDKVAVFGFDNDFLIFSKMAIYTMCVHLVAKNCGVFDVFIEVIVEYHVVFLIEKNYLDNFKIIVIELNQEWRV